MLDFVRNTPVPVIAAFIAFLGAVVFAPLMTRYLTNLYERKSKLLVKIFISDIGENKIFERFVPPKYGEEFSDHERIINNFIRNFVGYVNINISNNSSSTVRSVTLSVPIGRSFDAVAQINNSNNLNVLDSDNIVNFGDLQPQRSIMVHLYTRRSVSGMWSSYVIDNLHISADQIDKIHIEYPMPRYLQEIHDKAKDKRINRFAKVISWASLSLSGFLILYYIIKT